MPSRGRLSYSNSMPSRGRLSLFDALQGECLTLELHELVICTLKSLKFTVGSALGDLAVIDYYQIIGIL